MPEKAHLLGIAASFTALITACSMIAILIGALLDISDESASTLASAHTNNVKIVIDAGHGGEDGGASSNDVLEKDLNLEIATALSELYGILGVSCAMTRTDDVMLYDLYDELEDYSGMKKVYDLKNRLRFTKEANADLLVSIHMNFFPSSSVRGLQVYYSPTHDEARSLAERVQGYTRLYLQQYNTRSVKAGYDIFILQRASIPTILVECGFLSNPEELKLLTSEEYIRKLTVCLAAATLYES